MSTALVAPDHERSTVFTPFTLRPASVRLITGGGGAATTFTVIDAVVVRPPESVDEAVIVCVPTDSVFLLTDAPVPRLPLMLDVHTRPPEIVPSCVSIAVPVNVAVAPCVKVAPLSGPVIVTVGAVFPPPPVLHAEGTTND